MSSVFTRYAPCSKEALAHRLVQMLRPFILRRLKKNVEKQMPKKFEHVEYCQLSKRQRYLYDEFMSRANTREQLASGNYMTIINVLMQLRKVCNHPNLFAEPDVESPLVMESEIIYKVPSLVHRTLEEDPAFGVVNFDRRTHQAVDLSFLNLCFLHFEQHNDDVTVTPANMRIKPEKWDTNKGLVGFVQTLNHKPHEK